MIVSTHSNDILINFPIQKSFPLILTWHYEGSFSLWSSVWKFHWSRIDSISLHCDYVLASFVHYHDYFRVLITKVLTSFQTSNFVCSQWGTPWFEQFLQQFDHMVFYKWKTYYNVDLTFLVYIQHNLPFNLAIKVIMIYVRPECFCFPVLKH